MSTTFRWGWAAAWFLLSTLSWGQVSLHIHWVDSEGEPACLRPEAGHTLHVSSRVDGVTQTALQGEDLMVDSTGWCTWPEV